MSEIIELHSDEEYSSSFGNGHHGNLFQIKLLMHATVTSPNRNFTQFKISTEQESKYGKYDDICIEYTENWNGKINLILMQAKHKQSPGFQITEKLFLKDKNKKEFYIHKYFDAFSEFKSSDNIDNVYIVTNTCLESTLKEKYFEKIPNNETFFLNFGEPFKLQSDFINKLINKNEKAKKEFIKKSIFLTNTPNENELDQLIVKEMKNNFNIDFPDLHLFQAKFFTYVSDMLCKEKNKYLTAKKIEEFYYRFKIQYLSLDKFNNSREIIFSNGDQFITDLKQLFENDHLKIILVKTSNIFVTNIKIWQTIPESFKLNIDSIIYLNENELTEDIISSKIVQNNLNSLNTLTVIRLLECNPNDILAKLEMNENSRRDFLGKFILIPSKKFRSTIIKEISDELQFADLHETSKKKILEKKIEFLYSNITLQQLFRKDDINDEIYEKNLTPDVVNFLLETINKKNDQVNAGKQLVVCQSKRTCFDVIDCLYIKRHLILPKIDCGTENEKLISEENIFDELQKRKNIVIIAVAGMGKSLLLQNIQENFYMRCDIIKKYEIVIYVPLAKVAIILSQFKDDVPFTYVRTFDLLLEFFKLNMSTKFSKFSENVFKYHIDHAQPLLLLDEIDAVVPLYTDLIFNFVRSVQNLFPNIKIILASRHTIEECFMKNNFKEFYNLKELTDDEQINYLFKYWRKNLLISPHCRFDENVLENFSITLIKFQLNIGLTSKITSIPLLARILAKIFTTRINKCITECVESIQIDINLFDIYDELFQNLMDHHYKYRGNGQINANSYLIKRPNLYKEFVSDHEILALWTIVAQFDLETMGISKQYKLKYNELITEMYKFEHNYGIIKLISKNKNLHFTHTSLIYFLIAKYFMGTMSTSSSKNASVEKYFISHILKSNNFKPVRKFCNEWLKMQDIENIEIFSKLLNNDMIGQIIFKETQSENITNYYMEIVSLIKCLVRELFFHISYCILNRLSKNLRDLSYMDLRSKIINCNVDKNKNKILHYAARYNTKILAEWLIKNGADVNSKNSWNESSVHKAITYENFDIAILIEECNNLRHSGVSEMNKVLLLILCDEKTENDISSESDTDSENDDDLSSDNDTDKESEKAELCTAAENYLKNSNFDLTLEAFIELHLKKKDRCETKEFILFNKNSVLLAAKYGNFEILNYLLTFPSFDEKVIGSALLQATIHGHLNVIQILLDKVKNFNDIKNSAGNSLLKLAWQFKRMEIIGYLIKKIFKLECR